MISVYVSISFPFIGWHDQSVCCSQVHTRTQDGSTTIRQSNLKGAKIVTVAGVYASMRPAKVCFQSCCIQSPAERGVALSAVEPPSAASASLAESPAALAEDLPNEPIHLPVYVEAPTSVLQLANMVTADELADDREFNEIKEDCMGELQKFGTVVSLEIPRPVRGVPVGGVGSIYVRYDSELSSNNAKTNLEDRSFADRLVDVSFYSVDKFNAQEFCGVRGGGQPITCPTTNESFNPETPGMAKGVRDHFQRQDGTQQVVWRWEDNQFHCVLCGYRSGPATRKSWMQRLGEHNQNPGHMVCVYDQCVCMMCVCIDQCVCMSSVCIDQCVCMISVCV